MSRFENWPLAKRSGRTVVSVLALAVALTPAALVAHDPPYTTVFDRARCNFTSYGSNPYFPLWPGHGVTLQGEEDDGGGPVAVEVVVEVTKDTEIVDGVETRVVTETETEDDELVEVSRNFLVECRETGDVWYFGEEVDHYEGGVIVGHEGSWRAGQGDAKPGLLMPGSPLVGARFAVEQAPGVAEDRSEVTAVGGTADVPAGSFTGVVTILDTDPLSPADADVKMYAPRVGLIVDETLEAVEVQEAACEPSATHHCLQQGRFKVSATWEDFTGGTGNAHPILASKESGEFWFFGPGNTELLVKVIDACGEATPRFWVFAAGLTNVGVTLTVEDTQSPGVAPKVYENPVGTAFAPILDIDAFATCAASTPAPPPPPAPPVPAPPTAPAP